MMMSCDEMNEPSQLEWTKPVGSWDPLYLYFGRKNHPMGEGAATVKMFHVWFRTCSPSFPVFVFFLRLNGTFHYSWNVRVVWGYGMGSLNKTGSPTHRFSFFTTCVIYSNTKSSNFFFFFLLFQQVIDFDIHNINNSPCQTQLGSGGAAAASLESPYSAATCTCRLYKVLLHQCSFSLMLFHSAQDAPPPSIHILPYQNP